MEEALKTRRAERSVTEVKVIATDLDGTLITAEDEQDLYDEFRDLINEFRREQNSVWVICTGRDMKHYRRVFLLMEHYGIMPDFVILKHAYIYSVVRGRYVPHTMWNFQIRKLIKSHQRSIGKTLRSWHAIVNDRYDRVRTIALDHERLCMRFRDAVDSSSAAKVLRAQAKGNTLLNVFEYHGEVDVRVVPSTKGQAMIQLAGHLGLSSASTLTIGDGHNDLALMEPSVAHLTGCPTNAKEEIVERVHDLNGHVAREAGLRGVIEILKAYRAGTVCSDLPEDWKRTADSDNPVGSPPDRPRMRQSRHAQYCRSQQVKALWLLGAGGYMTAVIFAHFNLIPFSRLVLMPYTLLMKVIAHAIEFFDMTV
jgi:HAD superfamily hydrolase (TIGR01484 family)